MQDKPKSLPATQPNGEKLKSIIEVALDRRATIHFTPHPVPDEYLNAILLGAQAPSGYNLQPWRFIVVRQEENKKRLRRSPSINPRLLSAKPRLGPLGPCNVSSCRAPLTRMFCFMQIVITILSFIPQRCNNSRPGLRCEP